ncbi:MAG: hypothetical protein F6J93_09975 [Oscillatoria sp. SIO1A7]|nr:hypothetical protein [Oscillatoria sp. SIO1A7]
MGFPLGEIRSFFSTGLNSGQGDWETGGHGDFRDFQDFRDMVGRDLCDRH